LEKLQSSSSSTSFHSKLYSCVSTIGKWGKGGLFSALNRISELPMKEYEKSKKNKDLSLGFAHLVKISDELFVVNVCVQKMEKNSVSGILLEPLEESLTRVAIKAKELGASIHMPRIGYGLPNFNWYGVERIIKKTLSNYGIVSFVYYYKKSQSPMQMVTFKLS
jgi:chromodomain-helicase-DNA-binding protein 1-like